LNRCIQRLTVAGVILSVFCFPTQAENAGVVRVHFSNSLDPDLSEIVDTYYGSSIVRAHLVIDSIPGNWFSGYHLDYELVSEDSSVVALGRFHPRGTWDMIRATEGLAGAGRREESTTPVSVGYWNLWLKDGAESRGYIKAERVRQDGSYMFALADTSGQWHEALRAYHGGINKHPPPPTDAQGIRKLTGADWEGLPGGFIAPVWSFDGETIAMTRTDWAGIWIINSDGSGLERLTADRSSGYRFAWSPDSRHIAYRTERMRKGKRYFTIKVIDLDEKTERQITDFRRFLGTPRWVGADGTLGFETDRTGSIGQAHAADLVGALVDGGVSDLMAVTSDDMQVWISSNDGKDRVRVSEPNERCFDPILSPDGMRVCYACLGSTGGIEVSTTDGTTRHSLGRGTNARWAPDGSRLVFEITEDDGHNITGSDLYVIGADGRGKTRLTNTPELIERWPVWAPDDRQIAFSAQGSIFVLNTEPGAYGE